MLEYFYHMTLKVLKIKFRRKSVKILPYFTQRYNGRHYVTVLNL